MSTTGDELSGQSESWRTRMRRTAWYRQMDREMHELDIVPTKTGLLAELRGELTRLQSMRAALSKIKSIPGTADEMMAIVDDLIAYTEECVNRVTAAADISIR